MSHPSALPGLKGHHKRFLLESIQEGNATNFHLLFEGWQREHKSLDAQERKDVLNALLHEACSATFRFPSLSGTPSIVRHLLEAGADPNCRLPEKNSNPAESCLLARVFKHRKERSAPTLKILKILLEFGADPTEIAPDFLNTCDPSSRKVIEEGVARRQGLNLLLRNRKQPSP